MCRLHAELSIHRRQAHTGEIVVVHKIVVVLVVIAITGFSSLGLRHRLSVDCCLGLLLSNVLEINGILKIDGAVFNSSGRARRVSCLSSISSAGSANESINELLKSLSGNEKVTGFIDDRSA
jgi:hypothetical protein